MAANDQPTHEQFQALILRHRNLIERLCMRRAAGDYHRCAELRQDCYISIWRHAASLRPDASPLQERLWVYWQCRSVFSRLRFLRRSLHFIPLDVTLLEATTDSSWQALCSDFAISETVEEIMKVAPDYVFCRQVNRHDYTQVVLGDTPDAELLAISCNSKRLAIFHTRTCKEIRAVLYYTWPKQ